MINIKKVRKAEKLLGNIYSGFILSVQTYGFFVEIPELNVEGLVHVSTLNNDWYEYRSCLLYTSPSPRDLSTSRMPSSA